MIKVGDTIKYIGPDLVAYNKGKTYKVTAGYDKELKAYGVMSELGEDYYVAKEYLEEVK